MINNNNFIVSAAGSGKTTYLVDKALSILSTNVLITTFTEANLLEIKKKILERRKCIPSNITVQTWFSFLLQHGVRPYQGALADHLHHQKIGFCLHEGKSGLRYKDKQNRPIYWGEKDLVPYYFAKGFRIYSDKISKFVYESNKKTKSEVVKRLARIFPHIFIDEVQDLAGWDLELLKLLLKSKSSVLLVGDPRQSTYSTNDSSKHTKYRNGGIIRYITDECNGLCTLNTTALSKSHRNNKYICEFSSKIFPDYEECMPCDCEECRKDVPDHVGVFLVKDTDVPHYLEKFNPVVLRYQKSKPPDYNYGISKGLTFERVLIYPTEKIRAYLEKGDLAIIEEIKEKFYVALTRARHSVGIVCNHNNHINGLQKYARELERLERDVV